VLSRLNTRLCTLLDQPVMPRFVTAIYAVIDLQAGSLAMANAGHPSPLLAGAGGEVKTVQAGLCDPALGLVIEATYATSHHTIARGDRVLFLTDGWLEEPDAAGEEFGCARLAAQLKSAPADPDQALCALAAALQRHSGLTQCRDDLCAVLLQT
jgi:sigma-B regulation protein RsbU (phosphoserine phosphatase)